MFRTSRSRHRHAAAPVDELAAAVAHPTVWVVAAVALGLAGGRQGRRAALRGLVAAIGPAFLSHRLQRSAPEATTRRWGRARGKRPSLLAPSPDAATAIAFAVGGMQEYPAAGAVLLPLATAVTAARTRGGRRDGSTWTHAVAGAALGAAAGVATRQLWPVAPRQPAQARPVWSALAGEPLDEGEGMLLIVNPSSGPAWSSDPTDALSEGLPRAEIIRLDEDTTLEDALKGLPEARAIGVAGGDGTVNAVAEIALANDLPLLVVPSGTLNHFARDLGLDSVDDAIAAVKAGEQVSVDVGLIDGKPFLNTASFGSYAELVDAREQLEDRIGKWPAVLVALAKVLWRGTPVAVDIDGRPVKVWMIFIGNCEYQPEGLAPGWREQLDDGRLDVRLVDGSSPFSRLRLLAAVFTGRLARCPVYSRSVVSSLRIHSKDGDLRLARDGETFDGGTDVLVRKHAKPLRVFRPAETSDNRPG